MPRFLVVVAFTALGYVLSLFSVVFVYTENDNFPVFMQRTFSYAEKSFWAFWLLCLLLGWPFLRGLLQIQSFKTLWLKALVPGSLIALSMDFVFFLREAFPGFDFSGASFPLGWWIFKESLYGFCIGLPSLLVTTGGLALALSKTQTQKEVS